jgi:hypothetical protein
MTEEELLPALKDRIEELRAQLDSAETSFLSRRGWTHTSSTIDFCWRWVKTMEDGTRLLADRGTALSIEGVTDA